jgi:hypothetical protein
MWGLENHSNAYQISQEYILSARKKQLQLGVLWLSDGNFWELSGWE